MKAVILAGGLGTRLKPFTDVIPKPLLPVGEKSLLEVQLDLLRSRGVKEVFLAVGHKSEYISSFLGNGERYGVRLHYSVEKEPLGTAGPLLLLREQLTEPFLVMNGDILTRADFSDIMGFALQHPESPLTVVTKYVVTPYRFGNILNDGTYITHVEEKPDLRFEIVAGIYAVKPSLFKFIPENQYFGMDKLIQLLLDRGEKVTRYLLKEYWVDIGVVEDYEEAQKIYKQHFSSEDPERT